MPELWRVALIDSGLTDPVPWAPIAACRFVDTGSEVVRAAAGIDPIGHGTHMARILYSAAPALELMIGQVFDETGHTSPATVAAAIHWAATGRAHLIHMSLGLREDRSILAGAVAAAIAAHCIVVASTPSRGALTFPARYAGVIRATGDARCAADEISALNTPQADYGACVRSPGCSKVGGASIGAASLTGFIVAHLPAASQADWVRTRLNAMAHYRGAERRSTAN